MLALEGIKILDLSAGYPGAFSTQILGDLGAEVINVEGRPGLNLQQTEEKRVAAYQAVNRNKRSIVLNLKSEEARGIFYQLAEEADVIVDPFRPGVTKRLGIDYETINKINPRIIYCGMSGYGQDGPYRNMPGHDINYLSIAGALGLIGGVDGQPVIPLNIVADLAGAALHATIGILTAIIARDKTGKGQYIDISYTDSVIALLGATPIADTYFYDNVVAKRGETYISGCYPWYTIYETKDGKLITIGCLELPLWENLCRAIGREDFIPYHFKPEHRLRKPAGDKWSEISAYLKELFLTRTRDEWFDLLGPSDVPIGKVYSLDEVFTDTQILHRRMVVEVDYPDGDKIKQVGMAIKLSDTPGKVRSLSPLRGEQTDEILFGMGFSQEKVDELRCEGVVS